MARSKAKQKYQQFLEEQHRRNERNKQLVQMLERIEQQTEIMNARSERLKMMKLQYEMYFAKLVHSQTRRCIQNSVAPVGGPMMSATSVQPLAPNATTSVQQSTMEGYNYLPNANIPMMSPYQRYAPAVNIEKEQYSRQQYFNMPSNEAMEMPTLANFTKQNRSDEMNLRNEPRYEINGNKYDDTLPQNDNMDFDHITNMTNNPTRRSSASHLLPVDKEPADLQDSEKLTTTTSSSTFEEIPNVKMMSQMQINHNTEKRINPPDSLRKNNQLPHDMNNKEIRENVYAMSKPQSSTLIKSLPKTVTNVTESNNQIRNNIEDTTLNKTLVQEMITPGFVKPPPKSTEINQTKQTYEIPQNSTISTNNIKTENTEIPNLPNAAVNNIENIETNSSSTPVSIENIENAIYGELLSPLETEREQNQEPVSVVPTLLENLVTQSDPLDTQTNVSLEENAEIKLDTTTTTGSLNNNNNETFKEFEENSNNETPAYEQDINAQQNEQSVSNETDYGAYENVDPNTINETTQQEQSYDYSNYDPTQYSYPGYIYDETTGEYKPDPNAPPDQYAADQQYATEGYDQQYQQQNAYDYNQSYAQDTSSANLDNNAYNNNYDTVPIENASNIPTADSNLDQQQQLAQLQYSETEPQTQLEPPLEEVKENTSEEQPQTQTQLPAKVTKPTSILATTEKNDNQKKKKRVNFVDSSEADESVTDKEVVLKTKPATTGGSSESDFDFSSSVEGETKAT